MQLWREEMMQGLKTTIRVCARLTAHLASLVAVTSFCMADAMAAKMAGDPAATCGDLIRPCASEYFTYEV